MPLCCESKDVLAACFDNGFVKASTGAVARHFRPVIPSSLKRHLVLSWRSSRSKIEKIEGKSTTTSHNGERRRFIRPEMLSYHVLDDGQWFNTFTFRGQSGIEDQPRENPVAPL